MGNEAKPDKPKLYRVWDAEGRIRSTGGDLDGLKEAYALEARDGWRITSGKRHAIVYEW